MPRYSYIYQTKQGKTQQGTIRAKNVPQARTRLKDKGVFPQSVREESTFLTAQWLKLTQSVTPEDIMIFSRIFSGTLRSGIPIKEGLKILSKQVEKRILQNRLSEIIVDLESGVSLSGAFAKHVDIFPDFYPLLLKAGEASGEIAEVLDYIASYLERVQDIRKEMINIFTYPIFVGGIAMGLLALILIFVAPKFIDLFEKANVQLPIGTRILFFLSDVVKDHLIIVSLLVVGLISVVYFGKRTKRGARLIDTVTLKIPFFGRVIKDVMILRFLKAFDILINNSVPILQALKILEESTSNVLLREVITKMRIDVAKGLPISNAIMAEEKLISPVVAYTISTGEKTGDLGDSIHRVSEYVDRELEGNIKRLASRLNPLITLALGIMVLYIALAIYLPIWDMVIQVSQ